MQGHETWGKKRKNNLNLKEKNYLKLQYCIILKLQLETFLNFFKIRNFYNQNSSLNQKIAKFYAFREHKLSQIDRKRIFRDYLLLRIAKLIIFSCVFPISDFLASLREFLTSYKNSRR